MFCCCVSQRTSPAAPPPHHRQPDTTPLVPLADGAARALAAHSEWWLRNSSGSPMHNLESGRPANESWLTYDHTVPAAAAAWRDACLHLTASGVIDACYVDGYVLNCLPHF
eukprot:COSAG02_NODE_9542_length_2184_cov_13.197547_2_plen_111_part_00